MDYFTWSCERQASLEETLRGDNRGAAAPRRGGLGAAAPEEKTNDEVDQDSHCPARRADGGGGSHE